MSKTMLIDAAHSEETRVVVVGQHGLEEFDFESASLRTLKGNIYLAKVTRVEPSLQAAFVTYGGNRHGFLPFNEIHPDYYRIPVADREALMAAAASERADRVDADDDEEDDDEAVAEAAEADDDGEAVDATSEEAEDGADEIPEVEASESDDEPSAEAAEPEDGDAASEAAATDDESVEADAEVAEVDAEASDDANGDSDAEAADEGDGESEADGDAGSEADSDSGRRRRGGQRRRRSQPRRHYKIQEVIKRGQIMLVQVAKEERGGKGAAMTTYISLAGRYCVLMPNTGKGGGISRKITDAKDRKRLKAMVADLDLPDGMAVIVRTAGVQRTKAEIKRDHEFLLRLWEEIRERTFASTAPALIYEEASLVKRAIRDLYSRDVDEVLVEGDTAYREAKDFMRSLMPSHAKRVQPYKESTPLFQQHGVEGRLESLFDPVVRLPSGGYLVVNQTEALVAIDVNSGRATRERNIEETALKTNLEAAVEAARQLRLRELAGIVVIDFIDMEERRNNSAVERKLKDALKQDRARVHVGRMSPLGLIEMSRQRLRPSMFETSFHECPTCGGLGRVRSVDSNALGLLRAAEECAMEAGEGAEIAITAVTDAIVYLLNHKREGVARIEDSYGVKILFDRDDSMPAHERRAEVIVRGDGKAVARKDERQERAEDGRGDRGGRPRKDDESREEGGRRRRRRGGRRGGSEEDAGEATAAPETPPSDQDGDEEGGRKGGRRRGRRGGRRRGQRDNENEAEATEAAEENGEAVAVEQDSDEEAGRPRRRRRRRGRRRGGAEDATAEGETVETEAVADDAVGGETATPDAETADVAPVETAEAEAEAEVVEAEAPEPEAVEPAPEPEPTPEPEPEPEAVEVAATPDPEPELEPEPVEVAAAPEPEPEPEPEPVQSEAEPEPARPARTGWWSRKRA